MEIKIGDFYENRKEKNGEEERELDMLWEVKAVSTYPSFLDNPPEDESFNLLEDYEYEEVLGDAIWICLQNFANGSKFKWIPKVKLEDIWRYIGNEIEVSN